MIDKKTKEKIKKLQNKGTPTSHIAKQLKISRQSVKKYQNDETMNGHTDEKEAPPEIEQSLEIERLKTKLEDTIFQTVNTLNSVATERSTPEADTLVAELSSLWAELEKIHNLDTLQKIKKATDKRAERADEIIKGVLKEEEEAMKKKKKTYDKRYNYLVNSLIHILRDISDLIRCPLESNEEVEIIENTLYYGEGLNLSILMGKLGNSLQKHGFHKDQVNAICNLWGIECS